MKKIRFLIAFAFVIIGTMAESAEIKDSESASHGYDAAYHQIVDTYEYPGFAIVQLNLPVLSHYSYMLISDGQALVVDPDRDITAYLDLAKEKGLSIKGVLLTHSHADFIAGHIELMNATGCPIYSNAASGAGYKHTPVKEGSTIEIEDARIKMVETPGHTPDGMCAYVYSKKKDRPELIFTGDTLFVGSVGRPDLIENTTSSALASAIFETWNNKLSKVGDDAVILPAHGAGSLCGAHLSDSPFSTIGAQRASNPYLQYAKRSDFIAAVLSDLQEPPQYFKHNAAINKAGPDPVDWRAPMPEPVTPSMALTDPDRYLVADLRNADEYAAGHIPNSVNIGLRGRLETWVGIIVPWDADLVLCGSASELEEALYRLHRVGYQPKIITIESWKKSGLQMSKNRNVPPKDLYMLMQRGEAPIIIDVRLSNEWMGLRIGTVLNLPLNHLAELSAKLDPAEPVLTVCNSAYRSSMAVGILERKDFKNVASLDGGSEAWIAAGLPVLGAEANSPAAIPATTLVPAREIPLPERIDPSELKRLIMDLPGTFELVDIRPPNLYADFNVPGSRNVDIADLINNPAYLTGAGPLIIVDRDGSLAMAVAGILSQKTKRQIKALYGGLEAYWEESELKGFVQEVTIPSGVSTHPQAPGPPAVLPRKQTPLAPAVAPLAPAAPQTPKKKSAGC